MQEIDMLCESEHSEGVVVGGRKYHKVPETACMYYNGRHWVDGNLDGIDTPMAGTVINVGVRKYKKIPEDSILFYKQGYWINEELAGPVISSESTVTIGTAVFKQVPETSVMYYKLGHWALI